ncbi:MAG: hypothetical protein P4M11_08820 [Candidatus Pacebacteria bacterium]|nr:hypothetical protein [Candidatus Paceibacterota bacterium]
MERELVLILGAVAYTHPIGRILLRCENYNYQLTLGGTVVNDIVLGIH